MIRVQPYKPTLPELSFHYNQNQPNAKEAFQALGNVKRQKPMLPDLSFSRCCTSIGIEPPAIPFENQGRKTLLRKSNIFIEQFKI